MAIRSSPSPRTTQKRTKRSVVMRRADYLVRRRGSASPLRRRPGSLDLTQCPRQPSYRGEPHQRDRRNTLMTTTTIRAGDRVDALDWDALRARLDADGHAITVPLLDSGECEELSDLFDGCL